MPPVGLETMTSGSQASALPTELCQHSVASLNLHCLYKVMLYWSCSRNEQSPTCEVVHETNKAHFRNLLTNRFLPSSVGKALAFKIWRSWFQSRLGAIFDEIFFALPCVKICQIIWQKRLSWKTQWYYNCHQLEFFTNSQRYKNANIVNFILAVPLNQQKACKHKM